MKYLALISLFISSTALAQTSGYDEVVTTPPYINNEIIVEGIYDEPRNMLQVLGSVEVLDEDRLDTTALVHPAEILNSSAGVNIHRGSGQEHLTAIRSPVLTGGAGAGSFLYLEDGVPLRAAGFANVNGLFEGGTEFAGALEVFKGPGPALYGSNAVHGLINIQSKPVEGASNFRVLGSDDGLISTQASIQIGQNVRASGSFVSDNGFREDSGFEQQKIQLKYEGELGAWSVNWLTSVNNLNQETAGFIEGEDAYLDDDIRFTNPNPEAFRDSTSYRTQARFERDLGGKTLALTPYARRVELNFLRHFVPGQALEDNNHTSIGLQSAWYGDWLNIGADVEYTKGSLFEFQENPDQFSFVQGLHYDYDVDSFVAAAYAQKMFDFGKFGVELGLRAEYTHYDYDNQASDGQSGRFIRSADRTDDFFTLTPKINLGYQLSYDAIVYFRAARGSRAPQTVDLYSVQLNQVPGEADVETLDSLEAGWKYQRRGIYAELALYTQWKDNFFFRNANGFNVANGKTRHSGAELSLAYPVTDWLTFSGGGTLARHTYNFTEIVGSSANDIIDGARVDTAPDTLAHFRASVQPVESFGANIEWRHVGDYFTDPGNTQSYPGHDIFVLRSHYQAGDKVKLFGRIDNIFDTRYADRADFAFGDERFFPGRPRTLFVGVSADF